MSPDRIAKRLADAVTTLNDVANWLPPDTDPDLIADLDTVVCDLSELAREIQALRGVPA